MSEENKIINQRIQSLEQAIEAYATNAANDKPILLVSGDMSGIQPFLYQIVSSKAAKNLKGRSCYIDLLGKAVVERLLKALGLDHDQHVVCESGGTFVLLAPNTPEVKEELRQTVEFIEKRIFETHGTAIIVAIDSVEITIDEARGRTNTLGQRWSELFLKREMKKSAKCSSMMTAPGGYEQFFNPQSVNTDAIDAITGEDIADGGANVKDVGTVTIVNKKIIELGDELRKGCTLQLVSDDYQGADFVIEPAGLGIKFRLEKGKETKTLAIFEKMCENEDGLERLGVLRMDVDNLGSKFQEYASSQSLVAYSALSQELDSFFKVQVDSLCDKNDCYLLYGGGDDLFVVGEWRNVIKLASEIKSEFEKWAHDRKGDWSLSGGVAIVKAKYPIIEGAKLSGIEENYAKEHKCNGSTKNSFSLMTTPLNWGKEFKPVWNLKEKLVKYLISEGLPKAFLGKILKQAAKADIKNHKVGNVRIYWQLSYDVKRAQERAKDSKDIVDLLELCRKEVCTPNNTLGGEPIVTHYHPLELWALACRWAELEYRSINEK